MSWKDKLKKLRDEAKSRKSEQKLEHQVLAEKIVSDIGACLGVLEEFSSVARTEIKLFDNRHVERDHQTNKKYFVGEITLMVEKKKGLAESLLRTRSRKVRVIAWIVFPHPQAIKNMEWYEDWVEFAYSDMTKRLPLADFNLEWLKGNLEEAYQYFLTGQ